MQKILIVDDEPRNQRILTETLEGITECEVASNGEDALARIQGFLPDLVLLDIMMPGIDGYEVCRRIRQNPKLSMTKVLLVSGKAMIDERLKGYAVGADDYMTKPFVPDELLAKVQVFLRLTRLERELGYLNRSLDEKVQERTQQLVEAEGKLVAAAKMSALGEMAGGIAHEINTPLGTIGLIAEQLEELMADETIDRAAVTDMTRTVTQTVRRISTIIQGLRTFSRDGSQDRFESALLKNVIENTLTLCRERLKAVDIEMRIGKIEEGLRMECRPVQISQVLLNLIGNACDAVATLPEKWIELSVEKKGDRVEISVKDSGSGIPAEVLEKVFQPFFTTKEIGKGTGLGLSISKGIVDSHRGTLGVDEQCPNTRFVLSLPGQAAPAGLKEAA